MSKISFGKGANCDLHVIKKAVLFVTPEANGHLHHALHIKGKGAAENR